MHAAVRGIGQCGSSIGTSAHLATLKLIEIVPILARNAKGDVPEAAPAALHSRGRLRRKECAKYFERDTSRFCDFSR